MFVMTLVHFRIFFPGWRALTNTIIITLLGRSAAMFDFVESLALSPGPHSPQRPKPGGCSNGLGYIVTARATIFLATSENFAEFISTVSANMSNNRHDQVQQPLSPPLAPEVWEKAIAVAGSRWPTHPGMFRCIF